MHFADALTTRTRKTSPVCVGLDPVVSKLPEGIDHTSAGLTAFCRGIIDATAEYASCIKPQLAYFEVLGWEGMKIFWETCEYAKKKNLLVIADGKRNDIGSTCEAYAEAYLGKGKPVDALTVSPYLGSDGIHPFINLAVHNDKGLFVLVKTSNTSSGELQDLPIGDEVVHEHLAQLVEGWGAQHLGKSNLSCVGAVVGATYPEEMKRVREVAGDIPLLIPGIGAQGGDIARTVAAGRDSRGTGFIIAVARSIIFASSGKDFAEAARQESEKIHGAIVDAL